MSVVQAAGSGEVLPGRFSLSVIMQRSPSDNPWMEEYWEALGVSAGSPESEAPSGQVRALVFDEKGVQRFLYSGFQLQLHADECESYYHNLMSPRPQCYVVADAGEDDIPVPYLVSLSFDEAQAYLEGDEIVYAVDVPPELYRWVESFVLANYVPRKKTKRKLQNWSSGDSGSCPV